jgi:BirA family biotin operon repressor/biotin-[acetyl-CoA-carboxylase] ligase
VTGTQAQGIPIRYYDCLDSTNEEARRLLRAGETGPLWIAAKQQTAGRGRRGRSWVSEEGNLFATLLLSAPQPNSSQLAFVAALASAETIAHYAPQSRVALKWPNDVLLEGQKVCGILLEGLGHGALAIGIGINLANFPPDTEYPAISLDKATGRAPLPDEALAILASTMAAWYDLWQKAGFARLREAWLVRAGGLGRQIRARLETGDMTGIFEGLDDDGALLLRTGADKVTRITAGDVFL